MADLKWPMKVGQWEITEEEFNRMSAEAEQRGEEMFRTLPLVIAVRFDKRTRRVVIDTNKGTTLSVPVDLLQGLPGASVKDLVRVEILGPGFDIEWPALDQQFSLAGLLAGEFGNRAWMAKLGLRGGGVKPKSKAAASRANGAKGRRPRKRSATSVKS